MFSLDANDPSGTLVDRATLSDSDIAEIDRLMAAMGQLRRAELELSAASERYMKLNTTDMRALHLLIVAKHSDQVITPRHLADHLSISSASTTKMLDRLESAGHITRDAHPTDRRALVISINDETHRAAAESIGRVQARRAQVAARLTSAERQLVTDFLTEVATALSSPFDHESPTD